MAADQRLEDIISVVSRNPILNSGFNQTGINPQIKQQIVKKVTDAVLTANSVHELRRALRAIEHQFEEGHEHDPQLGNLGIPASYDISGQYLDSDLAKSLLNAKSKIKAAGTPDKGKQPGAGTTNAGTGTGSAGTGTGGQAKPTPKQVGNTIQDVANANPGDTITRSNGTVVKLTEADIAWARARVGNKPQAAKTTQKTEGLYGNVKTPDAKVVEAQYKNIAAGGNSETAQMQKPGYFDRTPAEREAAAKQAAAKGNANTAKAKTTPDMDKAKMDEFNSYTQSLIKNYGYDLQDAKEMARRKVFGTPVSGPEL